MTEREASERKRTGEASETREEEAATTERAARLEMASMRKEKVF